MAVELRQFSNKSYDFRVYLPRNCQAPTPLLFSHATGVPSLTYQHFLEKTAEKLGVVACSYDMRGFGDSKLPMSLAYDPKLWFGYAQDVAEAFGYWQEFLRAEGIAHNQKHALMGHSLGAWATIMATAHVRPSQVIALDPVMLPSFHAAWWALFAGLGQRKMHPLSRVVLRRKALHGQKDEIAAAYQKKAFFEGWSRADILNYLEAIYDWSEPARPKARKDSRYEAHVFQMQPVSALSCFAQLPKAVRHDIPFHFLIGEHSDVSNPRIAWLLKRIFAKGTVQTVNEGGHLFPLQRQDEALEMMRAFF